MTNEEFRRQLDELEWKNYQLASAAGETLSWIEEASTLTVDIGGRASNFIIRVRRVLRLRNPLQRLGKIMVSFEGMTGMWFKTYGELIELLSVLKSYADEVKNMLRENTKQFKKVERKKMIFRNEIEFEDFKNKISDSFEAIEEILTLLNQARQSVLALTMQLDKYAEDMNRFLRIIFPTDLSAQGLEKEVTRKIIPPRELLDSPDNDPILLKNSADDGPNTKTIEDMIATLEKRQSNKIEEILQQD